MHIFFEPPAELVSRVTLLVDAPAIARDIVGNTMVLRVTLADVSNTFRTATSIVLNRVAKATVTLSSFENNGLIEDLGIIVSQLSGQLPDLLDFEARHQ
jgi:hypothetical protein